MKISVILLSLFFLLQSFGQTSIEYKSTNEIGYQTGDRIFAGNLYASSVPGKYREYTIRLNDTIVSLRDFAFANPQYEFQLVVVWRQLGRKFPSLTQAATDSISRLFRRPASTGDYRQYVNSVDHIYLKDVEKPYMYLQVIGGNSEVLASGKPVFSGPTMPVLYKHYNDTLIVDTTNMRANEPIFITLPGTFVKKINRNTFLLKPRNKVDGKLVHLTSGVTTQRISHGVYYFPLASLPQPGIYINGKILTDSVIPVSQLRNAQFTSGYADEKLFVNFRVTQVDFLLDGKAYKISGSQPSKKILKDLSLISDDKLVRITRIIVDGPVRRKIYP